MSSSSSSSSTSTSVVLRESDFNADGTPCGDLQNLIRATSLRWIFVGGKGGVGKTTTSCSLATALARYRRNVLLISTDPAHNLSDAFSQQFNKNATLVNGYSNLYAMEIDPTVEFEEVDVITNAAGSGIGRLFGNGGFLADLTSSIPGIDEAMSFAELMKQVQGMEYDCIVFDTAPTGHTLRLLSFPSVLEKAFDKIITLKQSFGGIFSQFSSMLGGMANGGGAASSSSSSSSSTASSAAGIEDKIMSKLESIRANVTLINQQFKDPSRTTFVCVCIPEFLSLFETERLVQELSKYEIDVHNVVVNQVCVVEQPGGGGAAAATGAGDAVSTTPGGVPSVLTPGTCRKCIARRRMQQKYLDQIDALYEDFHVVKLPLLDAEVRGIEAIQRFATYLLQPQRAYDDVLGC